MSLDGIIGRWLCRRHGHKLPKRATAEQLGGVVTRVYDDGSQQGTVPSIRCPRCGAEVDPMDKGYPLIIPTVYD